MIIISFLLLYPMLFRTSTIESQTSELIIGCMSASSFVVDFPPHSCACIQMLQDVYKPSSTSDFISVSFDLFHILTSVLVGWLLHRPLDGEVNYGFKPSGLI